MRRCVDHGWHTHGDMHQADQPAVRDPSSGCHFRHMCPLDGLPGPHGPVLSCTAPMPLQPHMVPSSGSYATCKSLTCPLLLITSSILPNLRLAPPCTTPARHCTQPSPSPPSTLLPACLYSPGACTSGQNTSQCPQLDHPKQLQRAAACQCMRCRAQVRNAGGSERTHAMRAARLVRWCSSTHSNVGGA